jgi:hypothetical protein
MNKPNPDLIDFHGIKLPVEDLFSHVLITGRPGSGKSRGCVRPLLRALLALHAQDEPLFEIHHLEDPRILARQ